MARPLKTYTPFEPTAQRYYEITLETDPLNPYLNQMKTNIVRYKLQDELVSAVRHYKELFKVSIQDLANYTGYSTSTVSNDLNGQVSEPHRLLAYLDAMEVEWEFNIL